LALQRWRWAIASGYPLWVVTDVLGDTRRDAGSLINGTADFMLVPGPIRHSLMTLRRVRLAVLVFAAVVALAGISRWVIMWIMAGASEPGQEIAMHWAIPILISYLAYFALGVPEWRVRRRERARATGGAAG